MADEFGLLPTGFRRKLPAEIRASMVERLRPKWGASFDFTEGSPDGQLLTVFADEIGEPWRATEALYAQLSRDTATGVGLDARLLQTGTFRDEARPSSVTLLLIGDSGTPVPAGNRVSAASTGVAFRTIADATIVVAPTAWAISTAYVVGDLVSNEVDVATHDRRIYQCITAGTSQLLATLGVDGPSSTDGDITDNGAHWRYLGDGDGYVEVEAVSVDTGPVVAVAEDLSVIETPIAGWSAAWNLLDAELGRDVATDAEARISGEEDLARPAAGTKDAIRQTLLRLEGVTAVAVFQNLTDVVDADGVPPHAIECLITGGDDQLIRDTLLGQCVSAGIPTHGNVTGTATDSEGVDWTIKFSRAVELLIRVKVTLVKVAHSDADPDSYPTDGDDQVKLAIVTAGDARPAGYNAVASKIAAAVNTVTGVLDVSEVLISGAIAPALPTNPPVASTTIAVSTRQRASWDTSRIVVVTSDGVP